MNTMCYYPGYHHNEFDNICKTLIKIKQNRKMDGKIYPNMNLTSPCTRLSQYN